MQTVFDHFHLHTVLCIEQFLYRYGFMWYSLQGKICGVGVGSRGGCIILPSLSLSSYYPTAILQVLMQKREHKSVIARSLTYMCYMSISITPKALKIILRMSLFLWEHVPRPCSRHPLEGVVISLMYLWTKPLN